MIVDRGLMPAAREALEGRVVGLRPWRRRELSVRIRPRGGYVAPAAEPRGWGWAKRSSASLLLLIHGFNCDERRARQSYRSFRKHFLKDFLRIASGARPDVAWFFWPGDRPLRAGGAFAYPFLIRRALESAQALFRFLDDHAQEADPYERVGFVAHSLGCRLLMETLWQLHTLAGADDERPPVFFACLMAAAVPTRSIEAKPPSAPGRYADAVKRFRTQLHLLHSHRDLVLRGFFRPGQWGGSLGSPSPEQERGEAVGLRGLPAGSFERTNSKPVAGRFGDVLGHDSWGNPRAARRVAAFLRRRLGKEPRRPPLPSRQIRRDPPHTTFERLISGAYPAFTR